jgi:hypothetical protein
MNCEASVSFERLPGMGVHAGTREALTDPPGDQSLAAGLPRRLADAGGWVAAKRIVYDWARTQGWVSLARRARLSLD